LGAEIGGFRAHGERRIANIGLLTLDQEIEGSNPSSPASYPTGSGPIDNRIHPESHNGFVVSITHRSRAHFVRLDDPGAAASVRSFGAYIKEVFERARDAGDAHGSMLISLRPDGRSEALFDAMEPAPSLDRLPREFAVITRG
jgi:hypothetical protein